MYIVIFSDNVNLWSYLVYIVIEITHGESYCGHIVIDRTYGNSYCGL